METFFTRIVNSFVSNLISEQRYQMILAGLQVTLVITFFSVVLGTLLGGAVCWARMSNRPWLSRTAKVYIDLMRGTPVLVLLMLMYYVFMAPVEATGVVVAIVTFAMNTSAYIGEMLRTGIEGIDKGQREAGLALGYTRRQVFTRIILPQVVRKIMPVYLGEVISLLKGTSVVGYIAVVDMTRASDLIRSRTFDAFFPLIVTAAIYFLIAWLIGVLLNGLVEKKRKRVAMSSIVLAVLCMLGSIPSLVTHFSERMGKESVPPLFRRIENRSVGVIMGSVQDIAVTRFAPQADIQRLNSLTDMMASLENGKIDLLCGENITMIANPELATIFDTIDAGMTPTPIAACFRKGNTVLQEDFNRFIAEIIADGTRDRLINRWLKYDDLTAMPIPHSHGTGEKLTIATCPGLAPFNYICRGEPSGFEIEILTEWANRRNYQLEYLLMDFSSQIPAVQTGKADMAIGSIAITEERQQKVLFSEGYYDSRMLFYTRKGEIGMFTEDRK